MLVDVPGRSSSRTAAVVAVSARLPSPVLLAWRTRPGGRVRASIATTPAPTS